MTTSWTGGSSSLSRVLGTMPATLWRHSELTIQMLPDALVPEYPRPLNSASTSVTTASQGSH